MRTSQTLPHSSASVPSLQDPTRDHPHGDDAGAAPPSDIRREAGREVADELPLAQALVALRMPIEALLTQLADPAHAGKRWDAERQQLIFAALRMHVNELHFASAALQTLQRLHASPAPLRVGEIDLGDVLMRIVPRWQECTASHSFELALPGTVPTILGDEQLVEQALDLILDHAVRFSPDGTPVRVRLLPGTDEVTITTRHTGAGVHEPELARITEPFYIPPDGDDATWDGPSGRHGYYGRLDLHLAQTIAALHGGRLWAERPASGPGLLLSLTLLRVPRTPPTPIRTVAPVTQDGRARQSLHPLRTEPVVLVVERDARMLRYLRANLEAQRYHAVAATRLDEAQRQIALEEPDLVLLDAGPGGDAGETMELALRRILDWTAAPAIVLVERYDPTECAHALDLGAADYLSKPLSMEEVLARVRLALRGRGQSTLPAPAESIVRCGELEVDVAQRAVCVAGKPVALSKTEFKLLRTLAQNVGRVLTHEMLLERVWGPGYTREVEFVWVYIRRLRRKVEPDPAHPRYIQSVPGVGYRLSRE